MARIELPSEFDIPLKLYSDFDWVAVPAGRGLSAWISAARRYRAGIKLRASGSSIDDELQSVGMQYGFTNEVGAIKGISAAYLLAKSTPNNAYIAIMPVHALGADSKRYWVIGVDHGLVIPGTDKVVEADYVPDLINDVTGIIGVGEIPIFSPSCSDDFDGEYEDIPPGELFDKRLLVTIEKVKRLGFGRIYLALAVVIAMGVIWSETASYLERKAALEAEAYVPKKVGAPKRSASEIRAEAEEFERKAIERAMMTPSHTSLIHNFLTAYYKIPLELGGWALTSLELKNANSDAPQKIAASFVMVYGDGEGLTKSLSKISNEIAFSPKGDKAIVSIPFMSSVLQSPAYSDIRDESGIERVTLANRLTKELFDFSVSTPSAMERPEDYPAHIRGDGQSLYQPISVYQITIRGVGGNRLKHLAEILASQRAAVLIRSIEVMVNESMKWEMKASIYE